MSMKVINILCTILQLILMKSIMSSLIMYMKEVKINIMTQMVLVLVV